MQQTNKKRRILRRSILAAAIVLALVGTVIAVARSQMKTEDVSEEMIGFYSQNRDFPQGGDVFHEYEDAQLMLTFGIEGECHDVQFQAGWLPAEPNGLDEDKDGDGWTTYLSCRDGVVCPYEIVVIHGNLLRDAKYVFNGTTEIVKEDEWEGYDRMEITVDYTGTQYEGWVQDSTMHYLLLFSTENHYLVKIAGTSDYETLEKIAENLDIRVSEELAKECYSNGQPSMFDSLGEG